MNSQKSLKISKSNRARLENAKKLIQKKQVSEKLINILKNPEHIAKRMRNIFKKRGLRKRFSGGK